MGDSVCAVPPPCPWPRSTRTRPTATTSATSRERCVSETVMYEGISLAWSSLPTDVIGRFRLDRRSHERGGELEIHFYYRDRTPCLPILRDGQFQVVRWGNGRGQSRFLPRTGWTWQESVEGGMWR